MKLKANQVLKIICLALAGILASPTLNPYAYAIVKPAKEVHKESRKSFKLTDFTFKNWGLKNSFASHISVTEAWQYSQGSPEVVVAVIDTGIDPTHPDLQQNLWCKNGAHLKSNLSFKEKMKGCEFGWDYVTNTKNPIDTHGHGTHVAGIIGATANKKKGVVGVAPRVSIMAVRYYSQNASGAQNLRNTVKAFDYAIANGAHVINYSGGGAEFSKAEYEAIRKAQEKGIVVVAAAGNEHSDTDKSGYQYYPGAYDLSNIITVAATNIQNKRLSSSNWGKKSVDVAAPGDHIFSTIHKGRYGELSGTSQATAFVSGLAALMLSQDRTLTPQEIRSIAIKTADPVADLKGKIVSEGRINAFKALQAVRLRSGAVKLARHEQQELQNSLLHHPNFQKYEKRSPARKQSTE